MRGTDNFSLIDKLESLEDQYDSHELRFFRTLHLAANFRQHVAKFAMKGLT